MTFFELLIIYLTFGAPLGVYRFFQASESSSAVDLLKLFFNIIFWPPLAISIIRNSISNSLLRSHFEDAHLLDARTDEIVALCRERLRSALNGKFNQIEFRGIIEAYDRYTGLTLELKANQAAGPSEEIFKIARHSNEDLASICLRRRNRSRLIAHQNRARKDLTGALKANQKGKLPTENINEILKDLSVTLNDSELMAVIPSGIN
ncbi:MAG: hypothetical protein ACT4O9_04650, partial [Blastocatellia bacterium]